MTKPLDDYRYWEEVPSKKFEPTPMSWWAEPPKVEEPPATPKEEEPPQTEVPTEPVEEEVPDDIRPSMKNPLEFLRRTLGYIPYFKKQTIQNAGVMQLAALADLFHNITRAPNDETSREFGQEMVYNTLDPIPYGPSFKDYNEYDKLKYKYERGKGEDPGDFATLQDLGDLIDAHNGKNSRTGFGMGDVGHAGDVLSNIGLDLLLFRLLNQVPGVDKGMAKVGNISPFKAAGAAATKVGAPKVAAGLAAAEAALDSSVVGKGAQTLLTPVGKGFGSRLEKIWGNNPGYEFGTVEEPRNKFSEAGEDAVVDGDELDTYKKYYLEGEGQSRYGSGTETKPTEGPVTEETTKLPEDEIDELLPKNMEGYANKVKEPIRRAVRIIKNVISGGAKMKADKSLMEKNLKAVLKNLNDAVKNGYTDDINPLYNKVAEVFETDVGGAANSTATTTPSKDNMYEEDFKYVKNWLRKKYGDTLDIEPWKERFVTARAEGRSTEDLLKHADENYLEMAGKYGNVKSEGKPNVKSEGKPKVTRKGNIKKVEFPSETVKSGENVEPNVESKKPDKTTKVKVEPQKKVETPSPKKKGGAKDASKQPKQNPPTTEPEQNIEDTTEAIEQATEPVAQNTSKNVSAGSADDASNIAASIKADINDAGYLKARPQLEEQIKNAITNEKKTVAEVRSMIREDYARWLSSKYSNGANTNSDTQESTAEKTEAVEEPKQAVVKESQPTADNTESASADTQEVSESGGEKFEPQWEKYVKEVTKFAKSLGRKPKLISREKFDSNMQSVVDSENEVWQEYGYVEAKPEAIEKRLETELNNMINHATVNLSDKNRIEAANKNLTHINKMKLMEDGAGSRSGTQQERAKTLGQDPEYVKQQQAKILNDWYYGGTDDY